jgi:hypothetical protein
MSKFRPPYDLTMYDEVADEDDEKIRGCGCYLLWIAFVVLCTLVGNWVWGFA